jgi:hypothetical protein
MAAPLKEQMEGRLGADLSQVRVHAGVTARASAAALGARAYTVGDHVVIGHGGADRHTLAHELAHVIQQRQGPVAGTDTEAGLSLSDPGDRFEQEAETTARAVLRGPVPAPPHARRAVTTPEPPRFAVQRLRKHGGGVAWLADQDTAFLVDLVRATEENPGTYTIGGVAYDVRPEDLATAKGLLEEGWVSGKYKSYEDYAKQQKSHLKKHRERDSASLAIGSRLYHGTSRKAALFMKVSGLAPAQPSFRGGEWDASRDGFLSMTKKQSTVSMPADSIIVRMTVKAGDQSTWDWKETGGNNEVRSTKGVPTDRLEWWCKDEGTWKPISTLT